MKNPAVLNALDNILKDYVSARTRRLIHSLLALAVALASIYLAVNGDWEQFAIAVVAALYASANRANTSPAVPEDADDISGEVSGNPLPTPYEDETDIAPEDEGEPLPGL